MLVSLAFLCLVAAVSAFETLAARERRLAAGEAGLPDLAVWTGLTDRRGLLGLAGVRERPDGGLRFDPRFLDHLPAHPVRRAFDSYAGNGTCVALSLAALGGTATAHLTPGEAAGLLAPVGLYQLLGRLWSAAVWLELRTRR